MVAVFIYWRKCTCDLLHPVKFRCVSTYQIFIRRSSTLPAAAVNWIEYVCKNIKVVSQKRPESDLSCIISHLDEKYSDTFMKLRFICWTWWLFVSVTVRRLHSQTIFVGRRQLRRHSELIHFSFDINYLQLVGCLSFRHAWRAAAWMVHWASNQLGHQRYFTDQNQIQSGTRTVPAQSPLLDCVEIMWRS